MAAARSVAGVGNRPIFVRRRQMLQSQLTSPQEVSASEDQVKELEALERAEKQRLADLRAQDPEDDVRRAEKEVAVMQARVEQARCGLEECRIRAPKASSRPITATL